MTVTSVDDFFKLLGKSSLLSAEQLQAARRQLSGENDAKNVARKLLSDGRLTKWQALQLLNGRSALTIGPYRLRDALSGDNVARIFLGQHAETGQVVELRLLSRSRAAERPEALEEFVADVEKAAAASGRKVLEVHRPDGKDETCYVVLEEARGGAATAATSDSSADGRATADAAGAAGAADQASGAEPKPDAAEKPAVRESAKPSPQEPASAPAAAEARPPKLKPKAKPTDSAPAQTGSGAAAAQDEAVPATPADSNVEFKIPALEAAVAVSGAPADFKITRGKRRKKPAAAPAAKAAKAAGGEKPAADKAAKPEAPAAAEDGEGGEGDATATPASASKLALSPAMLIGGAVGGGLLLVVAVVVVAWLIFSGGDSTEVADAGGAKPPVEEAKEAPQEGEGAPAEPAAEAKPEPSEPADPVVSDPVVEVQPATPAATEPKPEAKAESAASGAKPEPAAIKPEPAAPDAKPAEPPAGAGAESGKQPAASTPPAEPAQPDAAKPEMDAKEPAAEETAGKEATSKETAGKKEAGKDTATKEPTGKDADKTSPPPPKAKNPFDGLKTLPPLPDVTDTNALVLGSVYVPAGELCFVKLRGGEKARRGAEQLVMKNANEGLDDKAWEISVRDAGGTETIVASLKLNDQSQLVFQWGPNAKAQESSPYLRNCAFSLSCAGESKAIPLRAPETVQPLIVDLSKPSSKEDWPIKMCPDPEAVRFAITGVQGAKCTVEPADPVPAKKTTVSVRIEDGGGMLSLKIDSSLTNNFQMTASPYIKLNQEAPKPDKFVRRMFENQLKAAQAQSEQLKQGVEFYQKYAKSNAKDAKQAEQRLPTLELDARNAETLLKNMKKIDDMMKALGEGMKIEFRVYYDADSTEVVLLKSGS